MTSRNTQYRVENKEEWRRWVTPVPLKDAPVHRWYYFPHSFTGDLVHALIGEWGLGPDDRILDPFCGAGTTLLAAKEKGIPATGYDLSPLAVLVSNVKVGNYSETSLRRSWKGLQKAIHPPEWNGPVRTYPIAVQEALPGKLLGAFDSIWRCIDVLSCREAERQFFQLAVLRTIRTYSRLVPTGGWLSRIDPGTNSRSIMSTLTAQVNEMIEDVRDHRVPRKTGYRAFVADARGLPDADGSYAALITSPPYPNRHDYTRVFGVELMFGFLNWSETRKLRYQSFESHPEAHPKRPASVLYARPSSLVRSVRKLEKAGLESRIIRMLEGYFLDTYLCLRESARVCRGGGRLALVVGNAQYGGERIAVDELAAELGEQVGLRCQSLLAVRQRGNSAQQMGEYGRNPSRESVVVFLKPLISCAVRVVGKPSTPSLAPREAPLTRPNNQ